MIPQNLKKMCSLERGINFHEFHQPPKSNIKVTTIAPKWVPNGTFGAQNTPECPKDPLKRPETCKGSPKRTNKGPPACKPGLAMKRKAPLFYNSVIAPMNYDTVRYYDTIQYYTILYDTMLCYVLLCYAMLYYTMVCYVILCCTILYCEVLRFTIL